MTSLVSAEVLKFSRSALFKVLIGLAFVAPVLSYMQTHSLGETGIWDSSLLSSRMVPLYSLGLAVVIGPLVAGIAGAVIVGQEYTQQTWRLLLTQGPSRIQVLASKAFVLSIFTLTLVGAMMLGGLAGWGVYGFGEEFPPVSQILVSVFWCYVIVVFWGSFGLALAALGRTASFGIAASLIYPWLETPVSTIAAVKGWLPLWHTRAVVWKVFGGIPAGTVGFLPDAAYPSLAVSGLVLLCYAALLSGITAFVFLRQDL